jgi:hypothetical protein
MATVAQINANQRNAQASTGPKTEAGKAAVAQNSTAHGLSGRNFALLPNEDATVFQTLVAKLEAEYEPDTPTESFLVLELAQSQWKLERVNAMEAELLAGDGAGQWAAVAARFAGNAPTDQALARLVRYEQSARRAWHQALNQITKLRSTAQRTEVRAARDYSQQMEELADRVMADRMSEPPEKPPQPPATPKYEAKPIPAHLQRELDAHKRRDPLFDPLRDRSQLSKELQRFFAKQGLL